MSDDWNLHDAVEDGIRDNAGHLALAGALMAHSQRKQQLQSLEASRRHQAEIAKTEAKRLGIEKQRLELEKLKQQAEKDEKEAVRLLRVMMAEVGAEFEYLAARDQLKGSPETMTKAWTASPSSRPTRRPSTLRSKPCSAPCFHVSPTPQFSRRCSPQRERINLR